jgi:hypothetical protein
MVLAAGFDRTRARQPNGVPSDLFLRQEETSGLIPSMITRRSLCLTLGLLAACSTVTQTRPVDTAIEGIPSECFVLAAADAGAPSDAAPPVASEPIRCANDAECGRGARCNMKLAIPRCVELYCVPDEKPCSADEQCKRGRRCYEGRCNPCNTCGNLCAVDFTKDPSHCGECNRHVAAEQTCVDGTPTCPKERPDLCGDACVDLKHDLKNCGACGNVVPASGATCNNGKSACPDSEIACGGACVDAQGDQTTKGDQDNCGACGKTCRADTECRYGVCQRSVLDYQATTCGAACTKKDGLRCLGGLAVYNPIGDTSGKNDKVVDLACTAAASPPAGYALHYVSCSCQYIP